MTCRPCLDTYIHTYKQTINQYKQIVIIHKSIETYSYTYTWLQMVRPPNPPTGGGGNIMCTCSIFVCRHKNNDMSTLLGHAHTYIPTDRQTDTQAYIHKSIQTYSYTYTWLHMCDVSPLWGGGVGGNQGGLDHIYIFELPPPSPVATLQLPQSLIAQLRISHISELGVVIHLDFQWCLEKDFVKWEKIEIKSWC